MAITACYLAQIEASAIRILGHAICIRHIAPKAVFMMGFVALRIVLQCRKKAVRLASICALRVWSQQYQ